MKRNIESPERQLERILGRYGRVAGSIKSNPSQELRDIRFLLTQIDCIQSKLGEARAVLRECQLVVFDYKYGHDGKWIQMNLQHTFRKALGKE